MSDLVDPNKAKQLGKMLGVEAIVVGTVSDLGNVVDVDTRIIDIETNNILPGTAAAINKDDTVRQMIERGREMPAPSSLGHPSTSAAPTVPAPTVALGTVKYQEFPQIRVEVARLQVLQAERIELVLNYVNKTQKEFLITLPGWCVDITTMSDDAGNEYRCDSHTGIASYRDGLTLPPGGSAMASFRFSPPGKMTKKGTRFSFNSTQWVRIPIAAGEPRVEARCSISILNIEPR
jgi:hypothetical protein